MRKTILFIDDDQDDRDLLREELLSVDNKISVAEVENGLLGLQFLTQAEQAGSLPCLIVLDLNMPVLDGKQTFQKINENQPLRNIPLVVYTSSSNPNDQAYFNNHGVKYFVKPASHKIMKEIANEIAATCR